MIIAIGGLRHRQLRPSAVARPRTELALAV